MKNLAKLCAVALLPLGACTPQQQDENFNEGWTFWSENNPEKVVVDLPHDAMQTETRSADAACGNAGAYFPANLYHYEKTFTLDGDPATKHITLSLEGVYQQSKVFVNGEEAGGYVYGYTGYDVCLDGFLKKGENTIRIDADNSQAPNSRWYSGAGIFRPLHLKVQDSQAYIQQVKILTKSINPAVIQLEILHQGGTASTSIRLNGKEVAVSSSDKAEITIPDAQLWSADTPTLYTAVVELKKDGKTVETQEVEFGIRTIAWSGQEGLLVNGQKTLLRGGCLHHDNGILGTAEYDDAAIRRLEIMKQYGFNAVRSSHNPCSEAVLRAADRLGLYVMDELWDTWVEKKTPHDYGNFFEANWQKDVANLVKKDFNHPSVIMYSIGNEVAEPARAEGLAIERNIIDLLHQLDSSRPTTAGMNLMIQMLSTMGVNLFSGQTSSQQAQKMTSEEYNKMTQQSGLQMLQAVLAPPVDDICSPGLDMLDIAGYNYGNLRLGMDAQLHPDRVTMGSETFPYQIYANWQIVEQFPNVVGDFMWTAWDYIGEVGIGAWYYADEENAAFNKPFPWVLAGAGALDLIGNPTAEAFMAKSTWLKDDTPYITVAPIVPGKHLVKSIWRGSNAIPNWSWPGCEGAATQVEVYTSAPSVQLFLNDKLIGEKATEKNCAVFDLTYQPGTLKAVTTGADGRKHEAVLVSATGQPHIDAIPEKGCYRVGDLIYVNINLAGDNGQVIANCDQQLRVKADGATLLGFGSGEPCTESRFHDGAYPTYFGQAQAILRAKHPGTATLTVEGEGLTPCTIQIAVKE